MIKQAPGRIRNVGPLPFIAAELLRHGQSKAGLPATVLAAKVRVCFARHVSGNTQS